MKRIILLTAILGIFVLHVSAQNKADKIKELFRTMKVDETMKLMIENMSTMMESQISGFKNQSKDSISLRRDSIFKDYVKGEVMEFSKKVINVDMVELYDKYFSLEEIQKYIEFYNTAEGKKMLDVLPGITKDLMSNMMSKDIPELQDRMKKKMDEIKS